MKTTLVRCLYKFMSFCARPLVGTGVVKWPIFAYLDLFHASLYRGLHQDDAPTYPSKHGFMLSIDAHDISIGRVLDVSGEWEPYITYLIQDSLHIGDTFLDIGANVGYFSLVASRKVGESGKVLAFEPAPKNFALLEKNISQNKFQNIRALQLAIGAEEGELMLAYNTQNPGGTTLVTDAVSKKDSECMSVRVTTIDGFLASQSSETSIGLVKMDIEGFEKLAFLGMHQLLSKKDRPKIIFEFSPIFYAHLTDDCRTYSIGILELLHSYGYSLFHIHEEKKVLELIEDFGKYYDHLNSLGVVQSNIFVK